MSDNNRAVYDNALAVFEAVDIQDKQVAAQELSRDWHDTALLGSAISDMNDRPGRPKQPKLVSPGEVPRRRLGSPQGRAALLHAIAHIEFNAIDLAADMICRFGPSQIILDKDRRDFISDWVNVCADEARHFGLLNKRMADLGLKYGDLPAHDGLWDAAMSTQSDIAARLAIAPLVLEARGLDVTPTMIDKLRRVADHESADLLEIIYNDEIKHVAAGAHWFKYTAKILKKQPVNLYHTLVKTHFTGKLKPPFNVPARDMAGLYERYYKPLSPI